MFLILSTKKSENCWKGKLLGPIFVMCGGKMETKFFTLAVPVKNLSNIRTLTIESSTDRLLKQILSHATYFGGPQYSLHTIHFTRWMNENQLSLGDEPGGGGIQDDIWSQNFIYLFINNDLEKLTN